MIKYTLCKFVSYMYNITYDFKYAIRFFYFFLIIQNIVIA